MVRTLVLTLLACALPACFADVPPPGASEGSSTGAETEASGDTDDGSSGGADDGVDGTTIGSASNTSDPSDSGTGAESDGGLDSTGDESSTDDSTGQELHFCDEVPPAIDVCRDFDGADPLAGWDPSELHGTVSWTEQDPVSPPNALVTSTTPDVGGGVSVATVGSYTGGLPLPIFAARVRVRLWIGPECFDSPMTRSAIQLAWVDAEDPDGPILYNLTFWPGPDTVMVAESNEPPGFPSLEHETIFPVPAGQWLDVEIHFALETGDLVLTVDGSPMLFTLQQPDNTLLAQIQDVPLSFSLGQAAQMQAPCTMRYDDYTIELL